MKNICFAFLFISFLSSAQQEMFDICPLKIGQKIPDNTSLTSIEGKKTSLKDALGIKPTILVFYRGGWCPYCVRHLSALQESKQQIDSLGYQIVAITPDQFDQLVISDTSSKADFTLYSDASAENIKAFGLDWKVSDELYTKYKDQYGMDLEAWSGEKHHTLPVPAVFIIKKVITRNVNRIIKVVVKISASFFVDSNL